MGSMGVGPDRNQDATVYVGDLDEQVTEELLWEFFLQCGPIVTVHIPRDKVTQAHSGFGFVEFKTEEDADYAMKILNRIPIFGRPIRVNMSGSDKRAAEVGANLYIGNLAPEIDEQVLYETFCAFGTIIGNTPKVMRDPDSGESKGFAFINFDSFEATDAAIEAMNGQYLCNRPISVGYAYKKDGTRGERHGSEAERLLAGQNPYRGRMPATIFSMQSAVPPPPPGGMMPPPPPPPAFMGGGLPMPGMMMMPPPSMMTPMMMGMPPMPPAMAFGGLHMMPPPPPPPGMGFGAPHMLPPPPPPGFIPPPPPPQ